MADDRKLHELDIPDGARDADDAVEVLRAFIGDGSLHLIFDPETFRHDVSEWGRLLSDIAHHVAAAVSLDGQMPAEDAMARMRDSFARGAAADPATAIGAIRGRIKH